MRINEVVAMDIEIDIPNRNGIINFKIKLFRRKIS